MNPLSELFKEKTFQYSTALPLDFHKIAIYIISLVHYCHFFLISLFIESILRSLFSFSFRIYYISTSAYSHPRFPFLIFFTNYPILFFFHSLFIKYMHTSFPILFFLIFPPFSSSSLLIFYFI